MENFSVLFSIYHKEKPDQLRSALDSIFTQTVRSNDVVLVEDGVLPKSLENVVKEYEQKYSEFRVLRFQENRGLGHALNDGIEFCKNEIIARMDTDDIAMPHRFQRQLEIFSKHPEYDMVGSWIQEFEHVPGDSTSIRRVPETPEANLAFAKSRCPVNHPTVMYKKSSVVKSGKYQTALFPEDYFLWIKMLQGGCKIYNIQEPLLWFRYSSETFQRRGGWRYAIDETVTQWRIYKMGFIGVPRLCMNVAIRFGTRIVPNRLRGKIYQLIRTQ